jgi:hypothetical protein
MGHASLHPILVSAIAIGSLTALEAKTQVEADGADDLSTNRETGCQSRIDQEEVDPNGETEEFDGNPYEGIMEGCGSANREGDEEIGISHGQHVILMGPVNMPQSPALTRQREIKPEIVGLKGSLKKDVLFIWIALTCSQLCH